MNAPDQLSLKLSDAGFSSPWFHFDAITLPSSWKLVNFTSDRNPISDPNSSKVHGAVGVCGFGGMGAVPVRFWFGSFVFSFSVMFKLISTYQPFSRVLFSGVGAGARWLD